ncbi:MAG: DUF937 domain-containing protein [Pirellula sp.]
MSEVLELLSSELDERRIAQIANHLGTDSAITEAAIAAALPTLVSAFGRTAETEQGAQMISKQMQGIGGGTLGELLGGLLGNSTKRPPSPPQTPNPSGRNPSGHTSGSEMFEDILPPGFESSPHSEMPHTPRSVPEPRQTPPPRQAPARKESPLDRSLGPGNELPPSMHIPPSSPGNTEPSLSPDSMDDVLGNVLGNKKKRVEDAIGKSSGLDLRKIGPLLVILAPLVLGAMRARASSRSTGNSKSLDPADLSEMMRGERRSVEQKKGGSLIGKMLDQDGDGDFDLSDMIKLGMRFFMSKR